MLGVTSHFLRRLWTPLAWVIPLLLLGLGWVAYGWNHESVFFGGSTYFVDGDGYARMTRVRMLQEAPLVPVRDHAFENFPIGTVPHTTSPVDYLIFGVAAVFCGFSADPLSLAGAYLSPLLGLSTLGLLAVFWLGRPYVPAALLLLAVSPIAVQGFLLGRPDHQSVLMFLFVAALLAEVRLWSESGGGYLSAFAWGLALWVSLFEPTILLGAILLARFAAGRLRLPWKRAVNATTSRGLADAAPAGQNCILPATQGSAGACPGLTDVAPLGRNLAPFGPAAVFLGILLFAGLWDGFRVAAFDERFPRWALNIGELRGGSLDLLCSWVGWLVVPAPVLLIWRYLRTRDPVCLLFAGLLLLLAGLAFWHIRWGYFLACAFALSLPYLLPALRWRSVAWAVFLVSLWPVARDWDERLYPDDEVFRARGEAVADAVTLREASLHLKDLPTGGVIAPWWLSPAVVWWSGQPCVAGTSHQSLPGIADTAAFFLSEGEGTEIVQRRQVRYVIAYEPERVVSNSAQILGAEVPINPLVTRLYQKPSSVEGFQPIFSNRYFRVFSVESFE